MNVNEIFVWTGSLLALGLYLPLINGVLRGSIEQSFATWALWVSLDVIALVSIALQKGNYLILVFHVLGSTTITCALLYKGRFKWTWFETFVSFLVMICLVIWWFGGSRMATIASTIAVVISGLPQFRESWQSPDKATGLIYLGYAVVNVLFLFGGKSWTVEDRFYPGLMIPLCLAIAFAALRRESQGKSGRNT